MTQVKDNIDEIYTDFEIVCIDNKAKAAFESFVQPVKADTVLDTRASVHESFRTLADDFGFIICTH